MAPKESLDTIVGSTIHVEEGIKPVETAELPTALAEHIAYGPGGIRGIVGSPYVFGAAFLASLGGFSFGYDQGVISIINVMPQFHATYPEIDPANPSAGFYKGFNTAMLEFGAFLGCFFMPKLADTISRKWALTVVVVIFNIGAIIQTASPNYAALVVGRTIGGIGVGTLALGAPLYISEIAPPNLRGALLVLESVSIVLGVVISYWITYGTRHIAGEASFRIPFGLQMVCATILGIGIHFFPYSPRWLSLVNRDDEALQSLAKLRRLPDTDQRVQIEWQGIMAEVEFQREVLAKRHPGKSGFKLEVATWLDLFRKKSWKRTIVGVGVGFFQQFSGVNAFIYYAPTLFQQLGQNYEMSLILAGILNIIQFVAVIICFFIIDRVGRRPLAIWGAAGMTVVYIVISIVYGLFSSNWAAHVGPGWVAVAFAFLYMLVYGTTYSPLAWALPSEVFSTSTRAKGVALSTATVWLCNFIVGVLTPPMLESAGFGTYVFFGAFCLLATIWAYFFVPEVKGKSLEEIDEVFGDSTGAAEREIMKHAAGNARRRGSTYSNTLHA